MPERKETSQLIPEQEQKLDELDAKLAILDEFADTPLGALIIIAISVVVVHFLFKLFS
jgi:hypothetical protein